VNGTLHPIKFLPKQVTVTGLKKASSKSANLSWKKIDDAKGYSVYMKKGKNGTYKKVADIKSKSITTYTAKKLSVGQTYYFCVRAYKTIFGEKSYGELSKEKKITLIND
jgi:YHS domain-containing protein